MPNVKPDLKHQFDELLFAATQVIEACDYGQTIIELDDAIDELRQVLNEIDYGQDR